MQLGYNTNGFAHHGLLPAIQVLHEIGYRCVAITLDHAALNPFAPGCEAIAAGLRAQLDAWQMTNVVETGARYLLDPHRKHHPTLVSQHAADRQRRLEFLQRAVDVAAILQSECVSIWSGAVMEPAADDERTWEQLTSSLSQLLRYADERGVVIAFEPEPDMFIDTMAAYEQLVQRLAHPSLKLTLDLGHLHCQGEVPIGPQIARWGDAIANIHIEDMRAGVHEHLMFGEGEMDFAEIGEALRRIRYEGPVNVELSRHSHMAPLAAQQAYDFLTSRWTTDDTTHVS